MKRICLKILGFMGSLFCFPGWYKRLSHIKGSWMGRKCWLNGSSFKVWCGVSNSHSARKIWRKGRSLWRSSRQVHCGSRCVRCDAEACCSHASPPKAWRGSNAILAFMILDLMCMSKIFCRWTMRMIVCFHYVMQITVDVDEDQRAAYFRQAKNGLYIRMALLKLLLVGWWEVRVVFSFPSIFDILITQLYLCSFHGIRLRYLNCQNCLAWRMIELWINKIIFVFSLSFCLPLLDENNTIFFKKKLYIDWVLK